MAEHANATRLRAGYEAFSSGDFAKLNEFIPEEAVWHVTGNGPLSGEYIGRDAVYGYFAKISEISGGTFKATLVHVLADDEYATAIQNSTGTVNGTEISTTDVLVDRIVDGAMVEAWVYFQDDSLLN